MSLQALAVSATRLLPRRSARRRARTVSAGYLSLIENGFKVPDEAIAVAIASALGEEESLFRAWVTARKRTDLEAALEAAEILRSFHAADALVADQPLAIPPAPWPEPAEGAREETRTHARLRIPVIDEGHDPGDAVRPTCPILEWRSLDTATLSAEALTRLDRPFAFRMGRAAPEAGLSAGDHALILRRLPPLPAECVCAVRAEGRVALRRLSWDGRRALVLPPPGGTRFELLEGPGALSTHVIGIARRVRFAT